MEEKKENENLIEGELIYNEEKGGQDMERLFKDDSDSDYDTYEIEFKIQDKDRQAKLVMIELTKVKYKKPYFGGYVNKKNGTYFYHAYAQTDQYINKYVLKEERDAQTYEYRSRSTKMYREFGTQMRYVGLYIDSRQDLSLCPSEYFSADKWEEKRNNTIIFLQKMMRGFFSRKACAELRRRRDEEKKKKRNKRGRGKKKKRRNKQKRNKTKNAPDVRGRF